MRGRAKRILVICFFLVARASATRASGEPANGGDADAERALYVEAKDSYDERKRKRAAEKEAAAKRVG